MDEHEINEIIKGEFDIEFPNFEKWNPNTKARRTYVGLSHHWKTDPRVVRLGMGERGWYVTLLSDYSQGRSRLAGVTLQVINSMAGNPRMSCRRSIVKLAKLRLIALKKHALLTYIHTYIHTEKTEQQVAPLPEIVSRAKNKKPKTTENDAAIIALYTEHYPRKEGRTRGLKLLRALQPSEIPLLETAMKNYATHCRGTEARFIKHFGTWAGEWTDWIDYVPQAHKKKPGGGGFL